MAANAETTKIPSAWELIMNKRLLPGAIFVIAAVLLGLATPVFAAPHFAAPHWRLDADNSELSFVTVKAADIAEAHTITKLSGSLVPGVAATASAELNIKIHLDSVDTNIPIRDERIREHLFDTAQYPNAAVHGHVPLADYLALAIGDSTSASLNLMLDLKALRVPVRAEVVVSRLGTERFMVTSSKPIIINAASVNLVGGIDKLQQLASLPSISKAVPVSFVLTFIQ